MAGSIKPSFFTTGPKEDLVVVDVYKPVDAINQPAQEPPAESVVEKANVALKNSPANAKNAVMSAMAEQAKGSAQNALSAAPSAALAAGENKINAYLDGSGDARSLMGESFTDDVLSGMGLTAPSLKQQAIEIGAAGIAGSGILNKKTSDGLMRIIENNGEGELSRIVKNGDLESATGIQRVLNAIGSSRAISVLDLDTQFAVLTGIIDKADQLGLINVADIVLEKIQDRKDQRRFILDNVFRFFTNGDLLSINRAIDMLGSGGVMARVPDGINLLLRYYRYPRSVQSADDLRKALRDQYDLLIGTLKRLNSGWYQIEWDGETLVNLEPYHGASRDAVSVLELNKTHHQRCVLAKRFRVRTVRQFCSTQYPFLRITQAQ